MKSVFVYFLFLSIAFAAFQCSDIKKEEKVSIQQENGKFQLLKDGKPYFIKGAVGWNFLNELKAAGANSLRSSPSLLNRADSLGLSMLVNLPLGAERNGFDYNDEVAVQQQFDKIKEIIETYKDHPAVLMWSIGNELDHIPGDLDYNLKLWDAINDIARMIKEIDPHGHPVMTVIGYGKLEKIRDIKERCPDLDLLGINAYASLLKVPEWLTQYGWDRPYVVTEWGPSGWWEVPRTNYGVVIEETSSEKAMVYRERYEKVILADPRCLGAYVFLWTSNRQERTHTWFNMFHNDLKTETVEVMQYMWTKEWPQNRAPGINAIRINGQKSIESIVLTEGEIYTASVDSTDPDQDALRYEWELLPEPDSFGSYAGHGEVKPETIEGCFELFDENHLTFKAPAGADRNYRLFVYVYDDQGNIGVANIPFYVMAE